MCQHSWVRVCICRIDSRLEFGRRVGLPKAEIPGFLKLAEVVVELFEHTEMFLGHFIVVSRRTVHRILTVTHEQIACYGVVEQNAATHI